VVVSDGHTWPSEPKKADVRVLDRDGLDSSGVTLAALDVSHAESMLRWMRDPAVADNIGLRRTPTLARTTTWIRKAMRARDMAPFAIQLDDRHVGNVVLDRIDRRRGTARLSLYVGEPDTRGRGVGRAAVELILAFAFRELELEKVWLTVHARNGAAIRTYLEGGFRFEGVHRGEFLLGGERIDEIYMGILRREYGEQSSEGLSP
jgi:RimJ/RimL family protein N-acetyltransferase